MNFYMKFHIFLRFLDICAPKSQFFARESSVKKVAIIERAKGQLCAFNH